LGWNQVITSCSSLFFFSLIKISGSCFRVTSSQFKYLEILPKLTCRSTVYENMWRNLDLQKRLSWLFVLLCWGTLVYTLFLCVCLSCIIL
jgi:hypothetical protein